LIAPDDDMPNAAGMYEKGERTKIHVAESQLEDLETLIATLAHESAHALLLGQDRLTGEEKDHEHVTDLVMVYSGMGIFAANTAVQHHTRQGYLPARVFGYAFALFAWIRHESSPPWAAYLGSDAADTFGKGLKYLSKTTDCLFDRETVDRKLSNRSEHELLSSLDDASESVQLAAIHELREQATPTTDVVDAIARLLRHENPILCCEAAQALGAIRLVTDPVINGLMTNLSDDDAVVQSDSVAALGELCPPLEFCGPYETSVRDELERLIDHSNHGSLQDGFQRSRPQSVESAAASRLRLQVRQLRLPRGHVNSHRPRPRSLPHAATVRRRRRRASPSHGRRPTR
jgi:hypothetical protein